MATDEPVEQDSWKVSVIVLVPRGAMDEPTLRAAVREVLTTGVITVDSVAVFGPDV